MRAPARFFCLFICAALAIPALAPAQSDTQAQIDVARANAAIRNAQLQEEQLRTQDAELTAMVESAVANLPARQQQEALSSLNNVLVQQQDARATKLDRELAAAGVPRDAASLSGTKGLSMSGMGGAPAAYGSQPTAFTGGAGGRPSARATLFEDLSVLAPRGPREYWDRDVRPGHVLPDFREPLYDPGQ